MSKAIKKLDTDQSQATEDAVVWFSVLIRGSLVGDADMKVEALSKLRRMGIEIHFTTPTALEDSNQ